MHELAAPEVRLAEAEGEEVHARDGMQEGPVRALWTRRLPSRTRSGGVPGQDRDRESFDQSEITHLLRNGKYHCTADLLLDWFGFGQTSKSVYSFNTTK